MITYPLIMPAVSGPNAVTLRARSTVGMSASPFTGEQQLYAHQRELWEADIALAPMKRAQAEEWIAFLLALNGMEGTFLLGQALNTAPRGVATGTPQVMGASQSGKTLITDGWTAGVTGILQPGDVFQLGSGGSSRLHQLTQRADSNGSGQATLDIWPRLRSAPADNAVLTLANPRGVFRLASNDREWGIEVGQIYNIRFSAIEAL
jgi:hypothetical protein